MFERYKNKKLSQKEQTGFMRKLAFLVEANIKLEESIQIIATQYNNKKSRKILEEMHISVSRGQKLSESLKQAGFDLETVELARAGEENGTLAKNLRSSALILEKSQKLKKKIIGALVYPAIIFASTIIMSAFLLGYIFPKVITVFSGVASTLPVSTRFLMFLSVILRKYWMLIVLFIIFLIFSWKYSLKKWPVLSEKRDAFFLKLPIVGKIIKDYQLARIFRSLGTSLSSGAQISGSLQNLSQGVQNILYKKSLLEASEKTSHGYSLSISLNDPNLFPDFTTSLINIGERSGCLPETLLHLADMMDDEVENTTKNLTNSLEPVLMLLMGLIVGFISLSIISPIYAITQNLRH